MKIEAVLFDADGVIQRPAVGSRAAFEKLLGSRKASEVDEFIGDVFAVEQPALIARGEFGGSLADVLTERQFRDCANPASPAASPPIRKRIGRDTCPVHWGTATFSTVSFTPATSDL
jgi:hypothetical protein